MALDPRTVNIGLIVPLTGADVDTWGEVALNPDFVALDGLMSGVQTVGVTNVPVTLTSPASYTPTPGPGPTQSQNRVLRFTGILTADVRVTLPLPGSYIIENLTTGNFVLSFQGVVATEVIGTPQGERFEVYCDGTGVRFVGMGHVGKMELWAGLSAMPAWVTQCTVKPYLYCDGTATYLVSDYPWLGTRFLSKFGGNGSTTFGVPDQRGRVPLAYDGTGTRITVAGCGLNGQTIGAAIDTQSVGLTAPQIPSISSNVNVSSPVANYLTAPTTGFAITLYSANAGAQVWQAFQPGAILVVVGQIDSNGSATSVNTAGGGTGAAHPNVQPSQVVGIWVVRT